MRQTEKESFSSFYPRFEKQVGDARIVNSPDAVKIGYLKATVEFALQRKDLGSGLRDYLKTLKL